MLTDCFCRPIDVLSTYHISTTKSTTTQQPTRYAIRQVLDQELRKEKILQASLSRQARVGDANSSHADHGNGRLLNDDKENVIPANGPGVAPKLVKTKRDFFGRVISVTTLAPESLPSNGTIDAASIAQSTAFKGRAKGAARQIQAGEADDNEGRIWVSFNEGFSNAVRKPITLADLMEGF